MAQFNFDSDSNIINNKIPSIKAINKQFCGKRSDAGLWIANDNLISCGWRTNCTASCTSGCTDHYVNTKEHIIQAQTEEVLGFGIINPRMCIIRRTRLLKITADKSVFSGIWIKGDGEIKNENGSKKYVCARRYLIMFLDEDNKPLHDHPLQLTAKGTFQINFDNAYLAFRNDIKTAYAKSMKKQVGQMNELWYAMCVFVPTFESKTVGKAPLLSQACSVNSYKIPNENNWLTLCVGRTPEINEIINLAFIESEKWIAKFERSMMVDDFDKVSLAGSF